jgi:hypothetical protein
VEWSGVEWRGVEWAGGVEWSAVEWRRGKSRMEWGGVRHNSPQRNHTPRSSQTHARGNSDTTTSPPITFTRPRATRGCGGLANLPAGAVVGTSSLRRAALLRRLHPHVVPEVVRGNLQTRLAKLDAGTWDGKTWPRHFDALILAAAGMRCVARLSSPFVYVAGVTCVVVCVVRVRCACASSSSSSSPPPPPSSSSSSLASPSLYHRRCRPTIHSLLARWAPPLLLLSAAGSACFRPSRLGWEARVEASLAAGSFPYVACVTISIFNPRLRPQTVPCRPLGRRGATTARLGM